MPPDNKRADAAAYMRNFVFGVEDSLVSTVGLLSGITVAEVTLKTILVTGIVLIFVEAFSMAVGSFLSESSAREYVARSELSLRSPATAGIIMFFSYLFSGFIPLFPYLVLPVTRALWMSIMLSLVSLFALGVIGARLSGISIFKAGIRTCVIGGIAIALGVTIGTLVNQY